MSEVAYALLGLVVGIGGPLGWRYVMARVGAAAGVASSKALADHEHKNDQVLEQLKAIEARRSTEFGLYRREQYRAYANVHRRFRIAVDLYAGMIGQLTRPDYARWSLEHVERYRVTRGLTHSDVKSVVDLVPVDPNRAADAMKELAGKVARRDASARLQRAQNAGVLEDLYLSDAVRDQITVVGLSVSKFAFALDFFKPGDPPPDAPSALRGPMIMEMNKLHRLMREELRKDAESGESTSEG